MNCFRQEERFLFLAKNGLFGVFPGFQIGAELLAFMGDMGWGEGVHLPVILCGIVAGSDVDTRAAVQIPHRSAQSGSRLQSGVNPGGDAVGGDDTGGFHGKQVAFDPAVVANGNGLGQGSGFQVIAQSLSWPADDINIHAVGAGADDAPQAAGSEFQIPVESVIDLLFVSFG